MGREKEAYGYFHPNTDDQGYRNFVLSRTSVEVQPTFAAMRLMQIKREWTIHLINVASMQSKPGEALNNYLGFRWIF